MQFRTGADKAETEPGRFDAGKVLALIANRRVLLRSNSRLGYEAGMFRPFEPVAGLRQLIEAHAGDAALTVGVHVRRTDNQRAIERSPLKAFEQSMQRELDSRPETRFFLATDDLETLNALSMRFEGRVLSYPKRALRRDDPIALEDAVVDLFCLARSRKVIGSYWSSFSETAWALRGVEHEVVGVE